MAVDSAPRERHAAVEVHPSAARARIDRADRVHDLEAPAKRVWSLLGVDLDGCDAIVTIRGDFLRVVYSRQHRTRHEAGEPCDLITCRPGQEIRSTPVPSRGRPL